METMLLSLFLSCICLGLLYCLLAITSRFLPIPSKIEKRTLLVIAHPDDESMFFAPTILHLTARHIPVYVLCLSNGNADGLGKIREKELLAACDILGIKMADVMIIDDDRLQDGMRQTWPPAVVSEYVCKAFAKYEAEQVITFDAFGVSGHANHCATHNGVRHCLKQRKPFAAWELETVGPLRKFSSIFDVFFSWLATRPAEALVHISAYNRIYSAMEKHASQLVWYRRLYLMFSRYMHINTLKPINP